VLASNEVLDGFLYTLFGGIALALFAVVLAAFTSVGRRWMKAIRGAKEAPAKKDTADIAVLKVDVEELKEGHRKISEWLLGGKDILGRDKHDGFIETFPAYQKEVRDAFTDVTTKLDQLPAKIQNGHGA
jgi:hypothetical protein